MIEPEIYEQKVFPYSKRVLSSIDNSLVPKIHFGVGTQPILHLIAAAGADVVLVGDSLAMVALGHATTLPVTLEQMIHHTQAVCRGFNNPLKDQPLVVCDLPFLSYQCGEDKAVAAAGSILKNSASLL